MPLGNFIQYCSVHHMLHSTCWIFDSRMITRRVLHVVVVVVVVVFFTLTDRASTIPINIRGCQSGTWSQRGTKVKGSHHATIRYSDQKESKSLQKVMRLYKHWHRPISKRFIKPPYSISRATSIDSDCYRLPTASVLSNKPDKLRSNQF